MDAVTDAEVLGDGDTVTDGDVLAVGDTDGVALPETVTEGDADADGDVVEDTVPDTVAVVVNDADCVVDADTDREGVLEAVGDEETVTLRDSVIEGDRLGDDDAVALALTDAVSVADTLGDSDGDTDGEGVGLGKPYHCSATSTEHHKAETSATAAQGTAVVQPRAARTHGPSHHNRLHPDAVAVARQQAIESNVESPDGTTPHWQVIRLDTTRH